MATTNLLTQIKRSDTFPIEKTITLSDNYGYLTFSISGWTEQMYYEFPAIYISVYVDVNGESVRYSNISLCYSINMKEDTGSITLKDIPTNCTLKFEPLFNDNAIEARNDLIDIGIISGTKWTTPTSTFPIDINLITD